MTTAKVCDRISTQNNDLDYSVSLPENVPPLKKKTLKTTIAKRKLELLTRCAESMTPCSSAKQPTHFTLVVEEKLSRLSLRNRRIADNRIKEFEGGLQQVVQTNQINQLPNQHALQMNQHISTQTNTNQPFPSRNSSLFSHGPNVFFQLNKKIVNSCYI